jgi:hypothetical protein
MKLNEIKQQESSPDLEELLGYSLDRWESVKGLTLRAPSKKQLDGAVKVKGLKKKHAFKYDSGNLTYSLYFDHFKLPDGTGVIAMGGNDGYQTFDNQAFHVRDMTSKTLNALIDFIEKEVRSDDVPPKK